MVPGNIRHSMNSIEGVEKDSWQEIFSGSAENSFIELQAWPNIHTGRRSGLFMRPYCVNHIDLSKDAVNSAARVPSGRSIWQDQVPISGLFRQFSSMPPSSCGVPLKGGKVVHSGPQRTAQTSGSRGCDILRRVPPGSGTRESLRSSILSST
ncbi:MAG: hypothetical protein UZ16_OP3001003463 [Candidatus Hinthialibacteria bacterium OLB16]|nr:MAG: hypothetical protein UZ16_OP3001003463 [Candidatus Hinthialibacteria bacterium OLB16]